MARPSFFALLLALALVFQTIAGATAGVRTMASHDHARHHCLEAYGGDRAPAPTDSGGGHAQCQHCLACAWGADVAILPEIALVFSREAHALRLSTRGSVSAVAGFAQVRRARGPPA